MAVMAKLFIRQNFKYYLYLAVILIAVYGLVPQISYFHFSLNQLTRANWGYVYIASGWVLLTFPIAAMTYYLLAIEPIIFSRTVLIQFANNFANRLLPAGIGGIGVSFLYLKNNKHTNSQAAAVVTANDLLGMLGHFILAILVLTIFSHQIVGLNLNRGLKFNDSELLIILAVVMTVLGLSLYYKNRLITGVKRVLKDLYNYRKRPVKVGLALLSSMALTLCNVVGLYFVSRGLNIDLSLAVTLIVFTLGIALGVATPTPGGVGGVEAGMVIGLIAYGTPAAQALAVVLVFRLLSTWFPALIGGVAFVIAERRGYLKF